VPFAKEAGVKGIKRGIKGTASPLVLPFEKEDEYFPL